MPLFVLTGWDGPRGLELRKLHREEHLKNLEPLDASGRIRYAGPLLDQEGNPSGSLILFEAEHLAAARAFAASDPYVVRGIFERYEVVETRMVLPADRSG
jgi:uncharacterized protein YciI